MTYKTVPFVAKISQKDNSSAVADQLQSLIDGYTSQGWEYLHLENVETNVAATGGCFGIGAQPGYTTNIKIAVFKK